MATNYTSKKLSFNNAEQFKESFFEPEPATVGYVFIGNHVPYANEASPNSIVDSSFDEKSAWDNMFAAKKITGNDVELVIPRVNWTANTKYKQFDDRIDIDTLLTGNTTLNVKPMYILTSERNVYKCLSNNSSANSAVEPTGDYTTANGTIATADGFIWKYMYNVKPSNRFLTSEWVPAPISTNKLDYNVSSTGIIDGEITTIIVTGAGTGYAHPTINAAAFGTGVTSITLANTTNVAANMIVSGTGIASGTLVSSVDVITSTIVLNTATTANGGGTTANSLSFITRVYIEGDGAGLQASANLSSNGTVSKITVDVTGERYSFANATIYGSGTGANTRVVLPPKFGHGFNPAKELDAFNVMISERIGSVDSTENGLISTSTSFRQYGLLRDPYKYGNASPVISSNAATVISQTTNLTLIAGTDFDLNEFVYQGVSANNAFFYGFVNAQSSNEVRLTKVRGTVSVGGLLIGANSGVTRTVVRKFDPEFQPYTGDILYVENTEKIQRADGQAENVKFVIRF
jgi:hypothetical protein